MRQDGLILTGSLKIVDLHISGSWVSILNNNTSYTKRMCFVFQSTCTPVDAGRIVH